MDEKDIIMANYMQQAQVAGEQNDPNSLYADYMREERITNIIQQINPEKLVVDIEYRIRGYKKNPRTKEWVKIADTKEVNEELVSDLVSYLGAILNDNTTLSNYSQQEINNIMVKVIDYVRDNLTDNDVKYDIVGDYDEMTRIGDIVCHEIFSALKRAMNGMEAKRIFSALKVSETLNQSEPKRGFMDQFAFWK